MAAKHVINVDLAKVTADKAGKKYVRTLAWGDEVTLLGATAKQLEVGLTRFSEKPDGSIVAELETGYITPSKSSGVAAADVLIPKKQNKVLRVNFVDVQQGDGSVIETQQAK